MRFFDGGCDMEAKHDEQPESDAEQ